ncbi:metal-dependent hydrolase [Salinadaptatus halalkaliphilus]|uniref:Metal-dependent hydrolase n=1 Tax=Salinadaptatus halalkaliphilus TaxID=2419781 RepID=A0A4S3TQQ4_9EURY|nr:metal-dependent hydrolase [Salinadaptatus halalkaliphilus]THE65960.1 metal-dependent hydrolase [Salinadaptatus halalkaliphilus]
MYQLGHYGAALLVYAPLGGVVAVLGAEWLAVVGGVVCVSLSTLPDIDHRLPGISHRGATHTVGFALLVGAAVASAAAILIDAAPLALEGFVIAFAFLVGVLAIGSHLLADALTPMGIRPFWPVRGSHYSLEVTRAANPIANYVLLALGVASCVAVGAAVTTVL